MSSKSVPPVHEVEKSLLHVDLVNQLQISEARNQQLQHQYDELNERFGYLMQATQDAVWDWDLVKNIGWYSDGMRVIFGYDAQDVGDGVEFWYNTIHPDDRDRVIGGIHEVIDHGGKHWNDKYRFRRKNGNYAWVFDRGYAIHDAVGKPIRLVGSMQDISKEVEARDALRESEEKFRAAFDRAAIGISISSPGGELLAVNAAFPRMFGYTEEELKTKTFSDLSHPEELEGDHKILQDLLAGRAQEVAREKRYLHKSGKILWGRVFGTVIYNANHEPKFIVAVLEDITEHRATLEALKRNEERLRLVIDSAEIGTWDYDAKADKVYWDDRCKAMFGMAPDDEINYGLFLKLVHPDDRQAADDANRDAMGGKNNGEYDITYRTIGLRDNKVRFIRAMGRSYFDASGKVYRHAGTVLDITAEKENEQRLKIEEERFKILATNIPQIVWTTDENGIVDYMTENWEAYTGHKPTYEEFSFHELMHPDDREEVIHIWKECFKKGIPYKGEYRLKNLRTHEYRWYGCTTAPLIDDNGKILKWIGSATDIHDQKMTEKELENKVTLRTKELTELNHRLEKSNSELEQYAFVTSHDLKEPIRKIQTYSSLIWARYSSDLPEPVVQHLTKIESAAQRMSGLIDDLLKYSRVSNPLHLFEPVDLTAMVKNICNDFEHTLKDKNIDVEVSELPVLNSVPIQMQQLFFNLFSNAIKFSKPGQPNTIVISHQTVSGDGLRQHAPIKEGSLYHKIIFKDHGIGFPQRFSEQIFTMFQRLNNREHFEGHGIGLALCRKIVSNHHGIMLASGQEGKGAEFTILLPAS